MCFVVKSSRRKLNLPIAHSSIPALPSLSSAFTHSLTHTLRPSVRPFGVTHKCGRRGGSFSVHSGHVPQRRQRASRKDGETERERGSGKLCERGSPSPFLSFLLSGTRFLHSSPHLPVLTHSLIHLVPRSDGRRQ